jgi:hypothetical protein
MPGIAECSRSCAKIQRRKTHTPVNFRQTKCCTFILERPFTAFQAAPSSLQFGDGRQRSILRTRHNAQLEVALAGSLDPYTGPDAFAGYTRVLSERGGYLIHYCDQDRCLFITLLRVFAWLVATSVIGWRMLNLPLPWSLLTLMALMMGCYWLVTFPIPVWHSVEIHPEGMIIDGELFFSLAGIGENWPSLQPQDGEDSDRLVLCGLYGTQFIEFSTCFRMRKTDRTPEVLAQDLAVAMEQLWGRRDPNGPAPRETMEDER